MVTNTAGQPSAGTAACFAYAAGTAGILANLFLIAPVLCRAAFLCTEQRGFVA
jgi:hypothetical protein